MKRIITILIMLSIFLMCMTACSGNDATPTIYDQLDSLATKSYRSVDLRVVTTTGDVQLLANYNFHRFHLESILRERDHNPDTA